MYSTIAELPTQVRLSLSPEDQKFWMDAYNKCAPTTEAEADKARETAWMKSKDRPSSFSFSAVASVEDWDIDREKISVDDLAKEMGRYIKSGGPMSWNHNNYSVGTCWGFERFTKDGMKAIKIWGNLYGNDGGVYDEVRKRFVKGANFVSVAGESNGRNYECDNRSCGFKRGVSELLEIAITPKPANQHAVMLSYNEDAAKNFAKSADEGGLGFDDMEYHMSEGECPILGLRKALRDCGIDAHAREEGVFVPFVKSEDELEGIGLLGTPVEGGMIVRERDQVIKSTYLEGLGRGALTPDGRFDPKDYDFFCKACDMGLVERSMGDFVLIDPLEAFEKANKAVEVMGREEGQRYMDESQPPQRGLHINSIVGGTGHDADGFDPDRFSLVQTGESPFKPEGGYYESTLLPNKGVDRASDAMNSYGETSNGGFITDLYPDAPVLHVRTPKDWDALFDKFEPSYYDHPVTDRDGTKRMKTFRYIPFQNLIRDYDAIQFDAVPNSDHVSHRYDVHGNPMPYTPEGGMARDEARHEKGLDAWGQISPDSDIYYPYRGRSNYRFILNPYSVMRSTPYNAHDDVRHEPSRTIDYAPYDRAKGIERLRARYVDAGIPFNWDHPASFDKAARWKDFGEEGRAARDAAYAMNEPEGPYEWLHTGNLSGNDEAWDPSKFKPIRNFLRKYTGNDYDGYSDMREGATDPDDPNSYHFMVQEGLPAYGLYASHRGGAEGSSHWANAFDRRNGGVIHIGAGKKNGFSFDLDPKANVYHVDTLDDYARLLRENPVWVRNGTHVGVNWEGLKDKGIQGVYFSPAFTKVIRGDAETKRYKGTDNSWFMDGGDFGPAEERFVLTEDGKLDNMYGKYAGHEPWSTYKDDTEEQKAAYDDFHNNVLKRKGRVLGLNYDGPDHLIITDPAAIGRNKPYTYQEKPEEPSGETYDDQYEAEDPYEGMER